MNLHKEIDVCFGGINAKPSSVEMTAFISINPKK